MVLYNGNNIAYADYAACIGADSNLYVYYTSTP